MKGSYVLLIHLAETRTITVGRLGDIHFPRGHYAYVGSAMSGFGSRLNHHLRRTGRPHWHIDYLRDKASVTGVILYESEQRHECAIARAFNRQLDCVPGFGASDCRCRSHLFFSADESQLKRVTMAIPDATNEPEAREDTLFPPTDRGNRWDAP